MDRVDKPAGRNGLCGSGQPARQNRGFVLLCLLTGGLLLCWPVAIGVAIAVGEVPVWGIDFKAYYLAGLRAASGASLYEAGPFTDRVTDPAVTSFLYPPIVAIVFIPFTLLPIELARLWWTVGQLAVLGGAVLALVKAAGVRLSPRRSLVVLWLVSGFQPVVTLARIGNISGFIAAGLCLSAAVITDPTTDRQWVAGTATALAVVPKPFVAPGAAHLLLNRRRLTAAAVTLGTVGGASLLIFGIPPHQQYLEILASGKGWGAGGGPGELPVKYRPFHSFPRVQLYIQGVLLCVTLLASLWSRRFADSRHAAMAVIALGSLTIPLVNPAGNTLTLVLAVPGLITAGVLEIEREGRPELVVLAILLVQMSVRLARLIVALGDGNVLGVPWQTLGGWLYLIQPATAGLLVVYGLLVYRLVVIGDLPLRGLWSDTAQSRTGR